MPIIFWILLLFIVIIAVAKLLLVRVIKFPTEAIKYDGLMKILGIIFWIILIFTFVVYRLLDINHLVFPRDILKFAIYLFSTGLPLIIIMIAGGICPSCGKLLTIGFLRGSSVREILRRKRCPECDFTFKVKKPNSELENKQK